MVEKSIEELKFDVIKFFFFDKTKRRQEKSSKEAKDQLRQIEQRKW